MKISTHVFVAAAVMVLVAGAAKADSVCTTPTSVVLDIIPAGCEAIMTNGPIYFNGAVATNGDIHNLEIDSLELFSLNMDSSGLGVRLAVVDNDLTAQSVTGAGFSSSAFFQTTPNSNSYSPDTGNQTFGIAHFIVSLPNGGSFKLNLGDNNGGHAAQNSTVVSSADDTTAPGNFTSTSFFDVFTELSLNGGSSFTVATNDFSGTAQGTGTILSLENETPEPASMGLFALGLIGVCFARRR